MSEKSNRRMAEEALDALNARDIDRYVNHLDDSCTWESETLPAPVRGRNGARQALEMYFNAFPNLRFETEQILTSGDFVVSRWRATGTHNGEFLGIPPTGKQGMMHGCTVSEIRNGKIIKMTTYAENASLFQQLGVLSIGKMRAAG